MRKIAKLLAIISILCIESSCKNNCDDIVCAPCPSIASEIFEILEMNTLGDSSFLPTELDSASIKIYGNTYIDSFLLGNKYPNGFNKIITNYTLDFPDFSGEYPDSVIVLFKNAQRVLINNISIHKIIKEDPGCCSCPEYKIDSIGINNILYTIEQLPILIKKQ